MKIHQIYSNVGRKISKLRIQRGMNQNILASKAGLDRSYLAHIERGKRRVSLEILTKITNALEITLSELFQAL
jgi:transcriptional regulator with XRE-family HTH domain